MIHSCYLEIKGSLNFVKLISDVWNEYPGGGHEMAKSNCHFSVVKASVTYGQEANIKTLGKMINRLSIGEYLCNRCTHCPNYLIFLSQWYMK